MKQIESILEKYARVIARQSGLVARPGQNFCTDGKTIWYPPIRDTDDPYIILKSKKGFKHEGKHGRFTDFNLKVLNGSLHSVYNALEDTRIERLGDQHWPGHKREDVAFFKKFVPEEWNPRAANPMVSMFKKMTDMLYLRVTEKRLGMDLGMVVPDKVQRLFDEKCGDLIDEIHATDDQAKLMEIAETIHERLKDITPKPKPQPQQSQGGSDEQSDESGESSEECADNDDSDTQEDGPQDSESGSDDGDESGDETEGSCGVDQEHPDDEGTDEEGDGEGDSDPGEGRSGEDEDGDGEGTDSEGDGSINDDQQDEQQGSESDDQTGESSEGDPEDDAEHDTGDGSTDDSDSGTEGQDEDGDKDDSASDGADDDGDSSTGSNGGEGDDDDLEDEREELAKQVEEDEESSTVNDDLEEDVTDYANTHQVYRDGPDAKDTIYRHPKTTGYKDEIREYELEGRRMVGISGAQLRRFFISQRAPRVTRYQTSGRLDLKRLWNQDSDAIFKKKLPGWNDSAAVSFVMDNSSSMGNYGAGPGYNGHCNYHDKWWQASCLMAYLAQQLDRLQVPFEAVGFSTKDEQVNCDHSGVRHGGIVINLMKTFEESYKVVKHRFSWPPNISKGTVEFPAIKFAADRLRMRDEENKIMFIFSDGETGCSGVLFEAMKTHILWLIDQGMKVVGIGIGNDDIAKYVPDTIVVTGESLARDFYKKLSEILTKGR